MGTSTLNGSEIRVKKDGETVRLTFKAVERGTKHEIDDKTKVLITGYWVSEEENISLPCISTISNYRWQLDCLIDRLFHPDKYSSTSMNENVDERVEYLTCWLMEHTEKAYRHTITELVAQIKATPEHLKEAAEKRIKAHIKESGV